MEILKHETDIDISHKLNAYELNAWLQHLNHLLKEVEVMKKMLAFDTDDELDKQPFLEAFEEKKQLCSNLIKTIRQYQKSKANALLCEDFQCDIDIIQEHEKHRSIYLDFLMEYRHLKNRVYRAVKGLPQMRTNSELKYG
jgi:hypothetical protein